MLDKMNSSGHKIQFINSPSGKWSVEKNDETTMIVEKSVDGNCMRIKKVLFANNEDSKNEKSGINLKINLLLFHYLNI